MSSRPRITKEIVQAAVESLAAECRWSPDDVEDVVSVYGTSSHMGGYEIARELDDRHGWDIDAEQVEALDNVWNAVRHEHERVCKQWATDNNIQPPHPIGTMTTQGEITGICQHAPASYLVRRPTDSDTSRLIVRFEEAVPAAAGQSGGDAA